MPSMNVRLGITGLAYCHIENRVQPADGDLQVLFLHADKRHNLRLIVEKQKPGTTIPPDKYEIPEHTNIVFSARKATSVPYPIGSGYSYNDHIVNIDRLHDPVKKLPFRGRNDLPALSYLSIPNAKCYAWEPLTTLEFWEIDGNTKNLKEQKEISSTVGVDFEVEEDGYLEFSFDSAQNIEPVTINYEAGATVTITFNNDCPDSLCSSDFRYYYQLLDGSGIEFEEMPPFPPPAGLMPSDKESSCNPADGDPAGGGFIEIFEGAKQGSRLK